MADGTSVSFDKFNSAYKLFSKANEKVLLAKYPTHLVHNTVKKEYDLFTSDIETSIVKFFGYFCISLKYEEALNEIFDFMGREDSLLRHVLMR